MDEDLQNSLRWVLLTTDDTWRHELARALAPLQADASRLDAVRTFLVDRLPAAADLYRPRMEAMIEILGRMLATLTTGPSDLPGRVKHLDELDRRIRDLEAQLADARAAWTKTEQAIGGELAPGQAVELGPWRFERRPDEPVVRVIDAARVPPELCKLVPDEARIRTWWRAHGSSPSGTTVVMAGGGVEAVRLSVT